MTAGNTLFTLGESDTDRGCAVLDGLVKVTTSDGTSRHLEGPEILGEVQLFTPLAKRTATVQVVVGGTMLAFEWHELGKLAQDRFTKVELAALRDAISHSANLREDNLLDT